MTGRASTRSVTRTLGWAGVLCAALSTPALHAEPPNTPAPRRAEPAKRIAAESDPHFAALQQWRTELGDEAADVRRAALQGLLALDADALPAIQAQLRGLRVDAARLVDKLTVIRAGASEPADLPHALAAALEHDRSPAMMTAVTLSALLCALEQQHSIAASRLIASELFALAPNELRSEATRTRKRLGKLLAPGWVLARERENVALQKLARDALAALGLGTPQRLYGDVSDPELLAAILEASGEALAADALPWLVAYLDDPRAQVRDAARRATAQFEGNGSELLRVRLAELTRQAPNPNWSAAELLSRVVEEEQFMRAAPAREALTQAEQLLAKKGDLERAASLLDRALTIGLDGPDAARLARAYLALGAQRDDRNQREAALTAFRRALRSDPHGPHAKHAQARVLYLEAEERLRGGVTDTHALRASLALDPKQPNAAALSAELERARDRDALQLRTRLGYAGALLLALASVLMLRSRRLKRIAAREAPSAAT